MSANKHIIQVALEQLNAAVEQTRGDAAETESELKLKIIEELLKDQVQDEDTHYSAR